MGALLVHSGGGGTLEAAASAACPACRTVYCRHYDAAHWVAIPNWCPDARTRCAPEGAGAGAVAAGWQDWDMAVKRLIGSC